MGFSKKIWAEGKWLDIWTLNHVLFGVISAHILLKLFYLPYFTALGLAITFYVVWEFIEVMTKAGEAPTNQFMDVLAGIAGFLSYNEFPPLQPAVIYLAAAFILLEAYGYAIKFSYLWRRS